MSREKEATRDDRVMPFVWLSRDDIDALHRFFDGRRLAVARSIYLAIVERITADDREFTRGELAAAAGVTKKTLDEYVPVFEEHGLLRVERRRDGVVNLPNVWHLLTVPPDGGVGTQGGQGVRSVPSGHADHPEQGSSPSGSSSSGVEGRGSGSSACLPLLGDVEVPATLLADADELLRRKRKVDGRLVTAEEMSRAVAAIAEINRQAGADFGVGAHLNSIVMRIRERPSWGVAAHVRLVQSAWRLKWWERMGKKPGRRPTPAVVYGNANVFEQVVQDATDEKNGRDRGGDGQPPAAGRRFTRED